MSQCDVTDAQVVKCSEDGHGIAQRVAALDAEKAGNPSIPMRLFNACVYINSRAGLHKHALCISFVFITVSFLFHSSGVLYIAKIYETLCGAKGY